MRRHVLLAAVLAVAVSGCWPQPRFDAGRTNANPHETRLTTATVGGLTELWSADVGPGVQAPIAVGDRLYVMSSQQTGSAQVDARAEALDAETGASVWVNDDPTRGAQIRLGEPAWHDGQIVVPGSFSARISVQGGLYRLDADTGATVDHVTEYPVAYGSVAVAADTLAVTRSEVVGSQCTVVQQVRWIYRATMALDICGGEVPTGFAIVGDRVLWGRRHETWGFSPACPPYPEAPAGLEGCGPDWRTDLGGRPTGPARLGDGAAVYADDTGTVSILDAATGDVLQAYEVGAPVLAGFTPAVGAGHVYVTPSDGRLVAHRGCDAGACAPAWEASLGVRASHPPVVAGDVVYVALADGRLLAFAAAGCGAATCEPLATIATGGTVTANPIVHDGRVYVGLADGTLTAYGLP